MGKFAEHVAKWKGCELCPLWESRTKMVFARGTLPADVLFIGEAPGDSEDLIGQPFVGPAGNLLNQICDEAWEQAVPAGMRVTRAFTNLVCCLPKQDREKREPEREEIKACGTRLAEMIALCKPKLRLIVCVGKLSSMWVRTRPAELGISTAVIMMDMMHPAAVIRMTIDKQGLAVQRCTVSLQTELEELCNRANSQRKSSRF